MNLENNSDYKRGVVMKPTILPARNRKMPFAIPNITTLRYDIIMM